MKYTTLNFAGLLCAFFNMSNHAMNPDLQAAVTTVYGKQFTVRLLDRHNKEVDRTHFYASRDDFSTQKPLLEHIKGEERPVVALVNYSSETKKSRRELFVGSWWHILQPTMHPRHKHHRVLKTRYFMLQNAGEDEYTGRFLGTENDMRRLNDRGRNLSGLLKFDENMCESVVNTWRDAGHYDAAIRLCEQMSLKSREFGSGTASRGHILERLLELHLLKGDYRQAVSCGLKAAIYIALTNPGNLCLAYAGLGYWDHVILVASSAAQQLVNEGSFDALNAWKDACERRGLSTEDVSRCIIAARLTRDDQQPSGDSFSMGSGSQASQPAFVSQPCCSTDIPG